MASKAKHMARSHRSYGSTHSIFNSFAYKADVIKNRKDSQNTLKSLNIGERMNNAMDTLKSKFRKAQAK